MKNKFGFLETHCGNMFWFVVETTDMTEGLEWDEYIRTKFVEPKRVFNFVRGFWDSGGDYEQFDIKPTNIKRWWTEEL